MGKEVDGLKEEREGKEKIRCFSFVFVDGLVNQSVGGQLSHSSPLQG